MGPLPDTIELLELVWTFLASVAAASSAQVWVWARGDLAYVRHSKRKHLARTFLEDVRNARWRLSLSLALTLAGVVAMTQPPIEHRTPAGWIIVCLIFGAPIQVILRNVSEATTRRTILLEITREDRNQPPGKDGDPPHASR